MNKMNKIFLPIILFISVVIIMFFSPLILSSVSKTLIFLLNDRQFQIDWLNQNESISSNPTLQFHISGELEEQIIQDSFYIEPEIPGNWTWLEDDLFLWQPDQPLPTDQLVQFGFRQIAQNERKVKPENWEAYVRPPGIVFLKAVSTGKELFSLSLEDPDLANQLTETQGSIIDFSVSPDGEQVVLVQSNAQSGTDFWMMDRHADNLSRILDCGSDLCSNPAWHPKKDEIVYTIEEENSNSNQPGWEQPKPFLLNLVNGNSRPVLKDLSAIGFDPIWSSNGQWITIWKGENRGIEIVHSLTQEVVFRSETSDDTGCWSPDERYFYYSNVREEGLPIVSIIYQVEVFSARQDYFTRSDLYDLGYNYYYPECHPKGEGVTAVVQIDPLIAQRELWWIKPDNSYFKIHADLTKMVTQFKWNPDGWQGIFLIDTLAGFADGAQIALWENENPNTVQMFQDNVFLVEWLP